MSHRDLKSQELQIDPVAPDLDRTLRNIIADLRSGTYIDEIGESFTGSFFEQIDFTVSSDGSTITGSLEKEGGGDLTMFFEEGITTLICQPACTITLTAGTSSVPQVNFIYIPVSTKALTLSTSDWPETEHIRVSKVVLRTAAITQTDDALSNQNWNDENVAVTPNRGHIIHIAERLRQEPAVWHDGAALTVHGTGGVLMAVNDSDTLVDFDVASGEIYQLHKQTFPALAMSSGADIHIVNHPTGKGGAYTTTEDMVKDLTHYADGTDAGVEITNAKFFNLVVWGIQNRTGETSHIMVNVPTGVYAASGNAIVDASGFDVTTIPAIFKGTGFLIARLTFQLTTGGGRQWKLIQNTDLRGVPAAVTIGSGGSGEANTASNQGAAGVGVFVQKTGVDLAFKNINAGSSKVTVTDDAGNNEIDIDITEGNIDHDALLNFTATEHYTQANIVATGALNSGSITSGFGNIDIGSSTIGSGAITSTGAVKGTSLDIGAVSVDGTELGILEGATVTTAELNKLDGVTATTAELNYVDVATPGTAEASKALVLDSSGEMDTYKANVELMSDLWKALNSGDVTATWTGSQAGYVDFDGVNDCVNVPDDSSLDATATGMTFSVWVNPDVLQLSLVGGKYETSAGAHLNQNWSMLYFASGFANFRIQDDEGTLISAVTTGSIGTGSWKHIVGTFDGTDTVKIYVDAGTPVSFTDASLTTNIINDAAVRFGCRKDNAWDMNGQISDAMFFNTELSAGEITTLFNLTRNPQAYSHANLVSWWKFTQNFNDAIGDNDGSVVGDAAITVTDTRDLTISHSLAVTDGMALWGGTPPLTQASAMTAENVGAINSGDATTDNVIIANRTRIAELEAALDSSTGIGVFP